MARRKMPTRVWVMFALLFFWVFYVFDAGLKYADGTLDLFKTTGYSIAALLSFVGVLGNFLAIATNNWQMPTKSADDSAWVPDSDHCVMTKATRCNWLSDRFEIPWLNDMVRVMSIGDICITFGLVFSLAVLAVAIFTR